MTGKLREAPGGALSREEAERQIAAWRSSGKRMKVFASERGLDFNHFRGWAAQLRRGVKPGANRDSSSVAFVEVDVRREEPEALCVAEVILGDGVRLVLREGVGIKELRILLDALGSVAC